MLPGDVFCVCWRKSVVTCLRRVKLYALRAKVCHSVLVHREVDVFSIGCYEYKMLWKGRRIRLPRW